MPSLNWIGKDAVIDHHRQVPYHLLRCDEKLSVGESGSGNLLVQGDNLLALKALLPYYAGQVKCIYIDPPYNTGDENWVYNDNVNAPEIRKWLGKVVGAESEDLSRHDKWLCMMYPRLAMLRQFLRADGMIFVSIDEHEVANLRLLMDEVFGADNAMGTLVWKRRSSSAMRGTPLSIDHEYILAYALDTRAVTMFGLSKGVEGYPNEDERGRYASTDLTVGMGRDARPGQFYPIMNPRSGKVYEPNPERVWRFFPETMRKVIEQALIIWPDEAEGNMTRPRYKTYYDPKTEKLKPVSSWIERPNTNDRSVEADETEYDVAVLASGMTQEGGKLIQQILGSKVFAYPKPLSLVRSLIRAATGPKDIVMDSFAGTGTTAHAVLDLNAEDGGNRRFLTVEMEKDICATITRERVARVVLGYTAANDNGGKKVAGLGGGFRFCNLSHSIFDENGQINGEVRFADLAAHVFFTETGEPIPKRPNGKNPSPLIGVCNGTAYYLLFNGVLGDKRPNGGNVLTSRILAELPGFAGKPLRPGEPAHDGPKVIYGEGSRLGAARLKREGVTFKQVPYEIKVS